MRDPDAWMTQPLLTPDLCRTFHGICCQVPACGRWPQAKDISDALAFEGLAKVRGIHGVPRWSTLWDTQEALPQFPPKVVLAKLRSMLKRKILQGCGCGCRGDFELPEGRP